MEKEKRKKGEEEEKEEEGDEEEEEGEQREEGYSFSNWFEFCFLCLYAVRSWNYCFLMCLNFPQ